MVHEAFDLAGERLVITDRILRSISKLTVGRPKAFIANLFGGAEVFPGLPHLLNTAIRYPMMEDSADARSGAQGLTWLAQLPFR